MQPTLHRINIFSILKFINHNSYDDFYAVKNDIHLDNTQYISADEVNINRAVWDSGDYSHRLNKVFLSTLHTPTVTSNLRYLDVRLLVPQGYSWQGVFGLHVIIRDTATDEVLISRMCTIDDFVISENKELIEGNFWLEEVAFKIPFVGGACVAQVTEVRDTDIDHASSSTTVGYITNYPYDYVVMIDEKPMPDYITTNIALDDNHYLYIVVNTTENKSIEQSVLDYFGLKEATVNVSHLITYGTDAIGYKQLRVSNEDYKYGAINIGLNLYPYYDAETATQQLVNIYVQSEIVVDGKYIRRSATMQTDLTTINPIVASAITHPSTNYTVQVVNNNVINQTVIEQKQSTKFVQIYQPIFMEFIKDAIIFEPKNIFFNAISKSTYLKLLKAGGDGEQLTISKTTSDNKMYFALTDFVPITVPTTYQLIDANTLMIIGRGTVSMPIV